MKYLFIVRHAKSSWDQVSLSDFDRPLNERGKESVKIMGELLLGKKEFIDFVLSSAAKRAIKTAKGICKIIEYQNQISTSPDIYHANVSQLLKAVSSFNNKHHNCAIFGHNPGLTEFYNYLTDDQLDNLPTAGVAKIAFDIEDWNEISKGSGRCIYLEFPRDHQ